MKEPCFAAEENGLVEKRWEQKPRYRLRHRRCRMMRNTMQAGLRRRSKNAQLGGNYTSPYMSVGDGRLWYLKPDQHKK